MAVAVQASLSVSGTATSWRSQAQPLGQQQTIPRVLAIARVVAGSRPNHAHRRNEEQPGSEPRQWDAGSSTQLRKAPQQQPGHSGNKEEEAPAGGELAIPSHVDAISSPSNLFVKQVVKLRQSSSYRRATGKVVVVGATPLVEITRASSHQPAIDTLLLLPDNAIPSERAQAEHDELRAGARRTVLVSPALMKKVAGMECAESVTAAALLPLPMQQPEHLFRGPLQQRQQPRRVLALEGVQDPGNLGSLLRSAAAFGWNAVLLLPGCCDPFNEKALRAGRGSIFRLPLAAIASWPQLLELAREAELVLLAADPAPDGLAPESLQTLESLCLVLGSEGQGLSEQASFACRRVAIPMPGHFESLNVAVAGGILMHLLSPKARLLTS